MTQDPDNYVLVPVIASQEEIERAEEFLSRPEEPKTTSVKSVALDQLVIEQLAQRDASNNKTLYTYDNSLNSLKSRGYQRHLRPQEAFRILIDSLEHPKGSYKQLAEDMLSSYGEWLSLAMLRKGDKLTCYLDPENIIWNASKSQYEVQGALKHAGEQTFTINKTIKSQTYVDLKEFHKDLQTFLYSRPYDQLPEVMKQGDKGAQLCLPPEGVVGPSGRSYGDCGFSVYGFYNYRSSRGVRRR